MVACSSAVLAGQNGSKDFVIQEAIDCAKPGDRIEIASGTYFENPVISTKISLVGIGNPVIDAGKKGSALTILADGVTIEGFILRNSSTGVYPDEQGGIRVLSNNNTIQNNIIYDNWDDIVLFHSSGNLINNNTLDDAEEGLDLIQSDNNTISHNFFTRDEDGIFIDRSYNNFIFSNQIINCSDDGLIIINNSQNNLAKENFVSGSETAAAHPRSKLRGIQGAAAVSLRSQNCTVNGNRAIRGKRCGIILIRSDANLISRNEAFQNDLSGISLDISNGNAITFNSVVGNGMIGIDASFSQDNAFYGNDIIQKSLYAAYDNCRNHWGDIENPNRYSDFDECREGCLDKQYPGICDHIYPIPGGENFDRYPMAVKLFE